MKRDTSITGGNIRNKLHIIGKFVSRGRIETFPNLVASIRTISEKDKTPNHDSVVIVQDDRMGFHICIVGY